MKWWYALLSIVQLLLQRWDRIEQEARNESAQDNRDEIDRDSAQYMADRYGNRRVQPVAKYHDAHKADRSE